MLDFLEKIQKDVLKFQETIKQEGDDLLDKFRKMTAKVTSSDAVEQKKKEIEDLLDKKYRDFEPHIEKLIQKIEKRAKKAGIDVSKFEKTVRGLKKKASKAKSKPKTKPKTKKSTTKAKSTKAKSSAKKKIKTKKKTTTKRKAKPAK